MPASSTPSSESLAITWRPRSEPLRPCAVAAVGDVARTLAHRVLRATDDELATLTGVAGDGLIVLLGDDVPWVDGVVYLGRDSDAPSLLLPTTQLPTVPVALLERALRSHSGEFDPPIAIVPDARLVCSVAQARPVTRARLEAWLRSPPSPDGAH